MNPTADRLLPPSPAPQGKVGMGVRAQKAYRRDAAKEKK